MSTFAIRLAYLVSAGSPVDLHGKPEQRQAEERQILQRRKEVTMGG